jgi:hypothetical protein
MKLTFIHFADFARDWKHYRLSDEDLQALETLLLKTPEAGAVMSGTGGMRKVRFAPPSRHSGKSRAYRVSYVYYQIGDTVTLLSILAKKDQANLTAAQKAQFRKMIALFSPKPSKGANT